MSDNPFDLSGRVAIVTGAGSGIGRATALQLAAQGARVLATDIAAEGLADTSLKSERIDTAVHDVTSASDWAAVFARARSAGRLDILVNNAGIMLDGAFETLPIEALRRQYAINVEGPFLGMQGAIGPMREAIRDHGARPSIINISSIYGQIAGSNYSAYSASKGAITLLSKAVANELAASGIRVNSIHPGPTATALGANHAVPRDAAGDPLPMQEIVAGWQRLIPMGRMGMVGDIAPVVAFLASDAAAYVTGAEIVVDGGYSAI